MKVIISLLFFSLTPFYALGFKNLSEAKAYAASHHEFPRAGGYTNFLRPDYTKVYDDFNMLTRFLEKNHLTHPIWSPRTFQQLLHKVAKYREEEGYYGDYILIKTPKVGTRFIIIGPLLGAFHSLVRDLEELKRQCFINDDLKITMPNTYLIFNGNVINGSPYVLETLTLVLAILNKNKQNAFYIKGAYESNRSWLNLTIKDQLHAEAKAYAQEQIPFERLITRLFNTLPLAIYLNDGQNHQDLLRISYFPIEDSHIKAGACAQSLKQVHRTMKICKLHKKEEEKGNIRAIIKGENRLISYIHNKGLSLVEPELGATAWSIFSGPNVIYKYYFHFFYDAFAILTIGPSLAETTITLYNQDVRDIVGFRKVMTYNILTGQSLLQPTSLEPPFGPLFEKKEITAQGKEKLATTPAITGTIQLGSTMDFSKSNRLLSKNMQLGISALINEVNQTGGINGKLLQVTFLDDQYMPIQSRKNIETLMAQGIKFILCPIGTSTLLSSLDLIKQKKIFVLFPNSGSSEFRQPDLENIVHFRVSYKTEAEALTSFMIKNFASKNFGFFFQSDSYGRAALEGATALLKKEGFNAWIEASYLANTVDVSDAVTIFKKALPDTIGFFSNVAPTIEFMRQLGSEFLAGKKLFAISPLGEQTFINYVKGIGLSITFSQVVPNPKTSDFEIVKEFRQQISKQALPADSYSLEGYIAASITADYFKKINGTITFEALSKLIQRTKNYNFKGLTLNFDPKTHELAHYLWIVRPDGSWVEQDLTKLDTASKSEQSTENKETKK